MCVVMTPDVLKLRDEALGKLCTLRNEDLWENVKKEVSLTLATWGFSDTLMQMYDNANNAFWNFLNLWIDEHKIKENLKKRKTESILNDNYLVFSVERIIDPKKSESDVDVKESIIGKIGIERKHAMYLYNTLKANSNAHVDRSGLADIPRRDKFTWKLLLGSKSQKRTFLWVMQSTWLEIDYTTLDKYGERIMKLRHEEKMKQMDKVRG